VYIVDDLKAFHRRINRANFKLTAKKSILLDNIELTNKFEPLIQISEQRETVYV